MQCSETLWGSIEEVENEEEFEDEESEEQDIINNVKKHGTKYEDSSFPASKLSLYRSSIAIPSYDANIVAADLKWLHPHELSQHPVYFNKKLSNAANGRLNDIWLLGAIAAIRVHPGYLLENIIKSDLNDINTYGVYTCRFYINGEWQDVVTDTRVPCLSNLPKAPVTPIYGHGTDLSDVSIYLIEKAYAKLHGSYESLNNGNIVDALLDLTGGSSFSIYLASNLNDSSKISTWEKLCKCFHKKYIIVAVSESDENGNYNGNIRVDSSGVPLDAAICVVDILETKKFRLVRLYNPWNIGEWHGEWSNNSSLWESHPEILQAASTHQPTRSFKPWRRFSDDYTFWISWDQFCSKFTQIHMCRIFIDPDFRLYCIHGEWSGKAAGGKRPLLKSGLQGNKRPGTADINSVEDTLWFNNPQYRLAVKKPTEVVVSLFQQNCRSSNIQEFQELGFDIVKVKNEPPLARVWDVNEDDVLESCTNNTEQTGMLQREASKEGVLLNPKYAYIIIPATKNQGQEGKFTLRIFSKMDIKVDYIPETHTQYIRGSWDQSAERDTAGGPMKIPGHGKKRGKWNVKWCQNPQYWVTHLNGYSGDLVDIKFVLRRSVNTTSDRSKAPTDNDRRKSNASLPPTKIGLILCKPTPHIDTAKSKIQLDSRRTDLMGNLIPLRESSLKSPKNSSTSSWNDSCSSRVGRHGNHACNEEPDRKAMLLPLEWHRSTSFKSSESASLAETGLTSQLMSNGFLVIPTQNERGMRDHYTLEVHSNIPICIQALSDAKSRIFAGEWTETTSGGSHLHPETWSKNPSYQIRFKSAGFHKVRICLSRNESEWRALCMSDSVGCMIGFYICKGTQKLRLPGNIMFGDTAWDESPFVPADAVSTPMGFVLESSEPEEAYTIVPTTFAPQKKGTFFLAVRSNTEFTMQRDRFEHQKGTEKMYSR